LLASHTTDLEVQSIAVVRPAGLGDMLCSVPALRALRAGYPRARITLVGLARASELVSRYPGYLDGFVEFRGFPGVTTDCDPRGVPEFLREVQERRFDLAVQMQGAGSAVNAFAALVGASASAGYYLPGHYCPDDARYLPFPAEEPDVRRWLRLVASLGCAPCGEQLEFPVTEEDTRQLERSGVAHELGGREYACVHPGASAAARRWGAEEFALVADALARRGLRVVLTGSEEELPLVEAVASAMRARPVMLAGRTSLGSLAALLAGARIAVCNDSAVSHLADALRVPSVVVFTASDPDEWAPLDRHLHRPVVQRASATHASRLAGVRRADVETVEAVLAEADDLLGCAVSSRPRAFA
jgi:ADP-heptose:LPS heptosyltransferase